jgi:hypothetical protein
MKYKNVRTKEECIADAKKYESRRDWQKNRINQKYFETSYRQLTKKNVS